MARTRSKSCSPVIRGMRMSVTTGALEVGGDRRQRRLGAVEGPHLEARELQHLRGRPAQVGVVVDEDDRPAHARPRQREREGGARRRPRARGRARRRTRGRCRPEMTRPRPRPVALVVVKGMKSCSRTVRRDARPVVGHRDRHRLRRRRARRWSPPARSTVPHRVEGVLEQVDQHLLEPDAPGRSPRRPGARRRAASSRRRRGSARRAAPARRRSPPRRRSGGSPRRRAGRSRAAPG